MAEKKTYNKFIPKLIFFLSVIGPGIIAANADNDAGGISTYSIVGAHFGLKMLWVLFLITFSLAITQEMGVRIGLITRQGLGGVIRENFSLGWTVFAMITMMFANLGTITAEFAGIASSFEIFGISKYLVVPIASIIIFFILYKGSFKTTQKIFLLFSAFYIVYIINGFIIKPDFGEAVKHLFTPYIEWTPTFLFTMIALIGTTITPWGQFFIQSYVVDKGLGIKHYKAEKAEVFIGAFLTDIVSFFIIISTATVLYKSGVHITDAKDAAMALKPLAGNFAQLLFAFGLFSASMLGAFILPVATAYALCEAFGWEYGFNTNWEEGKTFYTIIIISILIPAILVLIPHAPLIKIMILSQNINGILLPIILIFVMKIINNKEIMGENVNKPIGNIISWLTIIGIILATIVLVISSVSSWFTYPV
ncbi:MAG: natural resistance-associated macrophage protein [Candidatus Peregrinibacteria bacterium GW2011_GWF2_33_10]|nr:MAG: natural resistance-associated macrophage protein [Candidatus Peregrinibacteria bacterium GW2011_GWF2_33_10]OGJ44984.1 MAG: Mn transporter [Candidatus Peregrinibacteria bacterium RIFOXYA2_FULL_33_21]OGJ47458.1 MAG: Mn transporter [Candidatus Peregrinibacteria bacterium RIFOXYA12_FULL_33_12]OGJ50727.1 MAG: Mn transporter [Candidatus Peregrinibacteria bacterium RIFOXYB2_FULL_33_20]